MKIGVHRKKALGIIATEVDQALRLGPVAHIKHQAVTNGQHGLACLESYLLGEKNGEYYSLHDWGEYGAKKAGYPSIHVDATNNGLSYWAQEKFGMNLPEASLGVSEEAQLLGLGILPLVFNIPFNNIPIATFSNG